MKSLSIRVENKLLTIKRNFKSKFRSFILFGDPNRVRFGKNVRLEGFIEFGKNVSIQDYSRIRGKNIEIEDNVFIHENVFIRSEKLIRIGKGSTINRNTCILDSVIIGKDCSIAPNVVIVGSNHNFFEVNKTIKTQGSTVGKIVIEDDVWIAANVTILEGVTIGKGSIIAAGAVVNKSIEPYTIVGGVPAKLIKRRV